MVEGFRSLNSHSHYPIVATNKTYAEIEELQLVDIPIVAVENGGVIVTRSNTEEEQLLKELLPHSECDDRTHAGRSFFFLSEPIEIVAKRTRELFEVVREDLEQLLGYRYSISFSAEGLYWGKNCEPLRHVMESFGLPEVSATNSARRFSNSAIFVTDEAGTLIPFERALGALVASEGYAAVLKEARERNLLFTPSSKALSVTSAAEVTMNFEGSKRAVPLSKAIPVLVQNSIMKRYGGENLLFYAGDAANDLAGVQRIGFLSTP